MKPVKIAILSLTHGHTRKYFQTLNDNPNLDWVAVSAETEEVRDVFYHYGYNQIPCYMSDEEMFDAHQTSRAGEGLCTERYTYPFDEDSYIRYERVRRDDACRKGCRNCMSG